MQGLAGWGRWRKAAVTAGAIGLLAVTFMGNSGLTSAMLGGNQSANLASGGEGYERYYVSAPELTSESWLGSVVHPGQIVYADSYGWLRVVAMTGLDQNVFTDITPLALNNHAWIYATRANVIDHQARAVYGQAHAIYRFPSPFLDENYNLVYTDGSSEVFHR